MSTRRTLPPGPKGNLLAGSFPLAARDPLALYTEWSREFGDIFYYRSGFRRIYFLNHPDLVEQLLVTQAQKFKKDWVLRNARWLFGNGLLTAEGAAWKRQRRFSQPMFHRERITSYAETMTAYTQEMMAGWHAGETRSLHKDMQQLSLRIAAKSLFGIDLGDEAGKFKQPLNDLTKSISGGRLLLPAFLRFLPLPGLSRFRRVVSQLDTLVFELIAQRRRDQQPGTDLLSMLLEMRDEDGNGMSERQVRDEVITFLLAGHGTTAMALSWTWYLLSQHPAVEERLRQELKSVLAGGTPRFEDLPRLEYTARVVRESMRLYPPVWAFGRTATHDCEIGGYPIPKGAEVVACQWTTHRDRRFFEDPEQFDPDRWQFPRAQKLPKFAYFPFGGGERMCIGASFATTEAILVLATIAQKFRLQPLPGHPVVPAPGLTLTPKYGIEMRVEPLWMMTGASERTERVWDGKMR
ncbi:MAG TPA: cytochrome P450, partial [Terriglobales bacterium]|nr:cytochrome P450 [Terriglobales bacterium]